MLSSKGLIAEISKELLKNVGEISRDIYGALYPALDIVEDGSDLLIIADLPGFKREEINVRLAYNSLTINAEKEPPEYSGLVYMKQRPLKVNRTVHLPIKIEDEKEISGKYENGILTLRVPLTGVTRVKVE